MLRYHCHLALWARFTVPQLVCHRTNLPARWSFVKGLVASSIYVAPISNTNELHLHHVRSTIPSLSIIEEWVASCDVGLRKPDPEFYFFALRRAGVLPRQAIYIDDRPEMVDAGRSIGLKGVRFENSRQLDQDLQSIGLNL